MMSCIVSPLSTWPPGELMNTSIGSALFSASDSRRPVTSRAILSSMAPKISTLRCLSSRLSSSLIGEPIALFSSGSLFSGPCGSGTSGSGMFGSSSRRMRAWRSGGGRSVMDALWRSGSARKLASPDADVEPSRPTGGRSRTPGPFSSPPRPVYGSASGFPLMAEAPLAFPSVSDALDWAAGRLREAGIDNPRLEARLLAAHAARLSPADLVAHRTAPFPPQLLPDHVARRASRVPLAYLTGIREFWSLPFHVSDATLIPRPESESVVAAALRRFPDTPRRFRRGHRPRPRRGQAGRTQRARPRAGAPRRVRLRKLGRRHRRPIRPR